MPSASTSSLDVFPQIRALMARLRVDFPTALGPKTTLRCSPSFSTGGKVPEAKPGLLWSVIRFSQNFLLMPYPLVHC